MNALRITLETSDESQIVYALRQFANAIEKGERPDLVFDSDGTDAGFVEYLNSNPAA